MQGKEARERERGEGNPLKTDLSSGPSSRRMSIYTFPPGLELQCDLIYFQMSIWWSGVRWWRRWRVGPALIVTITQRTILTYTNTLSLAMSSILVTIVISVSNFALLEIPSETTKLAFIKIKQPDASRLHENDRKYFAGPHGVEIDNHDELVLSKMTALGTGLGYQCNDCQYSSTGNGNMRHHIESTHLDLNYQCSLCVKSLKSYKSWFMHMQRAHKH